MVGSVKRWQKSDPEKSKDTWTKLGIANSALENQLRILKKLSEDHQEAYESVVRSCSHLAYGKVTAFFCYILISFFVRLLYQISEPAFVWSNRLMNREMAVLG